MCETLTYLLDDIFVRIDIKLYSQIVGIPMDTYCAPLIADFLFFFFFFFFARKEILWRLYFL